MASGPTPCELAGSWAWRLIADIYEYMNKLPGIAEVHPDFPPLPDSSSSFPGCVIVYMGLPLLKFNFLYDVAFLNFISYLSDGINTTES